MLSEWICKWDQVLILRAWILFFINIASTTLSFSMHLLMRWLIWKRDLNLDLNQLLYNPKLNVSLFNSFLCKIYEENFLAIIFIIVWINNWFKNIKRVNYLSIKVEIFQPNCLMLSFLANEITGEMVSENSWHEAHLCDLKWF